jgi:hypothetical protein
MPGDTLPGIFLFNADRITVTYNLQKKKYCFKLNLFYFSQTI